MKEEWWEAEAERNVRRKRARKVKRLLIPVLEVRKTLSGFFL